MEKYRFKGSESFAIRQGWFEKALYIFHEKNSKNVFSNKDGVYYLGVGANMVLAIRYWLNAAGIYNTKAAKLTDFGNMIFEKDPYLEKTATWWLVHYNLATNINECPIFYSIFNGVDISSKNKESLVNDIKKYFKEQRSYDVNPKYVEDDLSVFLKSYCVDDEEICKNPEENTTCPLTALGLFEKTENECYGKKKPSKNNLTYKIIYYSLLNVYNKQTDLNFTIDGALSIEKGPGKVFNLDRHSMLAFVEEMQRHGLVTFNRTAGLNTVYFKEKKSLEDALKDILE